MLASTMKTITMMIVIRTASAAPMTCSRLRWRMNAPRSRSAAVGLEGRGKKDMRAEDRRGGMRPPVRLAVELEAQGDDRRCRDRSAALGRGPVAPVRHQMPASGLEEHAVRAPDRLDGD